MIYKTTEYKSPSPALSGIHLNNAKAFKKQAYILEVFIGLQELA